MPLAPVLPRGRNQTGPREQGGEAAAPLVRRQAESPREYLNFLTWPFFLAQLLAANQAMAALPVRRDDAEEETERAPAPAETSAAADAEAAALASMLRADVEEFAATDTSSTQPAAAWLAEIEPAAAATPAEMEPLLMAEAEPATPRSGGGGGGSSRSEPQQIPQNASAPGVYREQLPQTADGGEAPSLPSLPPLVPPVLPPVAELPMLDPIIDAVAGPGSVVDAIPPIVGAILPHPRVVETIDAVIDGVLGPSALVPTVTSGVVDVVETSVGTVLPIVDAVLPPTGVVETVDAVIDGALGPSAVVPTVTSSVVDVVEFSLGIAPPIADTIADIAPLSQTLETTLGGAPGTSEILTAAADTLGLTSQAVGETATELVAAAAGGIVEPVSSVLLPVTATVLQSPVEQVTASAEFAAPADLEPVHDMVQPAAATVATIMDDLLPASGGTGDLGSGGAIAFADPGAGFASLDGIFAGGRYTDYGIAMSDPQVANDSPDDPPATSDSPTLLERVLAPDKPAAAKPQAEAPAEPAMAAEPGDTPSLAQGSSILEDFGLRGGDGLF